MHTSLALELTLVMLNILKRSLSGGESPPEKAPVKKTRILSDEAAETMEKNAIAEGPEDLTASVLKDVPPDTPPWGKHILVVMKQDFNILTRQIADLKIETDNANTSIKSMDGRLNSIEVENKVLRTENNKLQEKLLDLEYRQRRVNLLFDGIAESENERDTDTTKRLRDILKHIPGVKKDFGVERCHRLGPPRKNSRFPRPIICCFSSYGDLSSILRNRKKLPSGVFVSEDLPEEWVDRRKVLKPIFNAAKRQNGIKEKTFLTKDKLVISGRAYSALTDCTPNYKNLETIIDLPNTCQRSNGRCTVFQGMHSYFSNLFMITFVLNNVIYNSAEQCIQAAKARLFGDNSALSAIMNEVNPYKIKKLGSRIQGFNIEQWKGECKNIAYQALYAKFSQNADLKGILLATGTSKIGEATLDDYWGIGL